MRLVSFFIALSLLPAWLALDISQKSSLAEAHCGSAEIVSVPGINDKVNACIDVCGASVVAATQTALAVYNNAAGNIPTTDPTDHTFLLWAEGNAPVYNSAINNCANAVQTLRTTFLNLPDSETDATTDPVDWQNDLPNTDGFPPFSVPSTTAGSGSTSSGGSPNPTGPASPTQSGHKNGAGVFSTRAYWLATLGAAVVLVV